VVAVRRRSQVGHWQNPTNWQPIAPLLALSWQHTTLLEQQRCVPSGQPARAC
jgi:hypothetical protein